MWIERISKLFINLAHGGKGLLAIYCNTRHQGFGWRRTDTGLSLSCKVFHKLSQACAVLTEVIVQKSLKVTGDLYVHGRRNGLVHGTAGIGSGGKKSS